MIHFIAWTICTCQSIIVTFALVLWFFTLTLHWHWQSISYMYICKEKFCVLVSLVDLVFIESVLVFSLNFVAAERVFYPRPWSTSHTYWCQRNVFWLNIYNLIRHSFWGDSSIGVPFVIWKYTTPLPMSFPVTWSLLAWCIFVTLATMCWFGLCADRKFLGATFGCINDCACKLDGNIITMFGLVTSNYLLSKSNSGVKYPSGLLR